MFDHIFQQLNDLRVGTALLEACGWDEELAQASVFRLQKVMMNFGGGNIEDLKQHVRNNMLSSEPEIVEHLIEIIETQFPSAIDINMEIN
jgi:hypothetical protein